MSANTEKKNTQYTMANAVVSNKRVYMRKKDMEDLEKELETSRKEEENPEQPDSNSAPENPISADENKPEVPWQKRYSDLQSYTTKQVNELKEQLKGLSEQKTELENKLKNPIAPPASEEELQDWVKQFPPLYNIMRTIVLKEKTPEVEDLKKSIKELEDFKQQVANERGRTELLKLHPDAQDYDSGGSKFADFSQWYEEQEPEVRSLIDSGIPSKIGRAISIFKKDKGIFTKTVQDNKKEASKAVNLGPSHPNLPKEEKIWRESEVHALTPRQYERFEPEIEKARAEGRYIRDLTG